MGATRHELEAAQAVIEGLPTIEEGLALVRELEAVTHGQPLSEASAARLSIVVYSASFVRRFARPVVVTSET